MSEIAWESIWIGAGLVTMEGEGLGLIDRGLIATSGNEIIWAGPEKDASPEMIRRAGSRQDLNGGWIFPGFIDCHTHLVFAGNRSDEFERRLEGATYEEIARSGGGIRATVDACREASFEELLEQSLPRARNLVSEGVTTLEVKSGYGLNFATEAEMLRVAKQIGERLGIDIVTTFLGAHALPQEFADNSEAYIELICEDMLPQIAAEGLADAVDGFCENIAFTPNEIRRVFDKAATLGLPVKLHADQLSDLGGASLVAEYGGLSADHLEYTSELSVKSMAKAGTVAVLLPGAFYTLGETQHPPIGALRRAGVAIALATDCNPGSSPISSLRAILNMGCTLFGLTPTEALRGITVNAAKALGQQEQIGRLRAGMKADFVHYNVMSPTDLCYWLSGERPDKIVKSGSMLAST